MAALLHDAGFLASSDPGQHPLEGHVADEYDRLVAPRLHGAPPLAPATALARMWALRGTRYDATLLAVVVRPAGERARWARPRPSPATTPSRSPEGYRPPLLRSNSATASKAGFSRPSRSQSSG